MDQNPVLDMFCGTFLPGVHWASYRAPEDPELANLGVVVVSPETKQKVMKKIDFFLVRWLSRIYLEPIDPTLT